MNDAKKCLSWSIITGSNTLKLINLFDALLLGMVLLAVNHLYSDEIDKTSRDGQKSEFQSLDTNFDDVLSESEYLAQFSAELLAKGQRDFQVFDLDANQELTFKEFLTIPAMVSASERAPFPDPVMDLVEKQYAAITTKWNEWDKNGDGSLDQIEFSTSRIARLVPGLTMTQWDAWDRSGDGKVSQEDCRLTLEVAYGIRHLNGELLHTKSGFVIDWMGFQRLDANSDGQINSQELFKFYLDRNSSKEDAQEQFDAADTDKNALITLSEWAAVPHRRMDVPEEFLNLDTNLDGQIDKQECLSGSKNWREKLAPYAFQAFDLDKNNFLSLSEYQLTPLANPLERWEQLPRDTDNDGRLSLGEFRWREGVELAALTAQYFRWFDVTGDGYLDLDEYDFNLSSRSLAPRKAVFRKWDRDQDSALTIQEILRNYRQAADESDADFEAKLARVEDAFYQADVDRSKTLSSQEFQASAGEQIVAPRSKTTMSMVSQPNEKNGDGQKSEFQSLDTNFDDVLSESEYLAQFSAELLAKGQRDFQVFDLDANQELTFKEFLTIPAMVSASERAPFPDPVMDLVEKQYAAITTKWNEWDKNGDGSLDQIEFSTSRIARLVPGLTMTQWDAWDRSGDGKVSQEDCRLTLEVAYGIRHLNGELLHTKSGFVIDWMGFQRLDANSDGQINSQELFKFYLDRNSSKEDAQEQFDAADTDKNALITLSEWAAVPHRRMDVPEEFLNLDTNLDGQIDKQECLSGSKNWREKLAPYAFQAFDLDKNNFLSLSEYQLTPLANPLERWEQLPRDTDNDGRLSLGEFRWREGVELAALTAQYFRWFDVTGDGYLDLDEYDFNLSSRSLAPRKAVFRKWDRDQDSALTIQEILRNYRQAADESDADFEAKLARVEDAFYQADVDRSKTLSSQEFQASAGEQIVAPRSKTTMSMVSQPNEKNGDGQKSEFQSLDTNFDDVLSESEYLAQFSAELLAKGQRDFQVFDLDANQELTFKEFLTIPAMVSASERAPFPDPVMDLVEKQYAAITTKWNEWDKNGDGSLDQIEFSTSRIARLVPGLTMTQWDAWDRSGDGKVSQEDCRLTLEVAYGIRHLNGELLHTKSGFVIDWMGFQRLDANSDGQINSQELFKFYLDRNSSKEDAQEQFDAADTDKNALITLSEWAAVPHRRMDVPEEFLNLDTNLDGQIDKQECLSGSKNWREKLAPYAFQAFDLDKNNFLSLSEYQLTPLANPLERWEQLPRDTDNDGRLSLGEFRWREGVELAALTAQYFRWFDVTGDGYLDLDEYDFNLSSRSLAPRKAVFRKWDRDQDSALTIQEILRNYRQAADESDADFEAKLARVEDAFYQADVDRSKTLSSQEFQASAGEQIVAPKIKSTSKVITDQNGNNGIREVNWRMWFIVTFNVLLLLGVATWLIKKT